MPRRPASPFPAPPGTAADRQADGRDPAWWPLYVAGGDATVGYTGYEVWRITSTVEKQGGRTLTDANPGFPLVPGTAFEAGDYALVRSGPGTGGLEFEMVPVGITGAAVAAALAATDCRASAGWDEDTCLTWAVPAAGRGRCASVPPQGATPLTWDADAGGTGVGGWVGVSPLSTDRGAEEVRFWREKGDLVGTATYDGVAVWLTRQAACRNGDVVFVGSRELCVEDGEEVSATCGDHTFEIEVGCKGCDGADPVTECGSTAPAAMCGTMAYADPGVPGFVSSAFPDPGDAPDFRGRGYTALFVGSVTDFGHAGPGWVLVVPVNPGGAYDQLRVAFWCDGGEWRVKALWYGYTTTSSGLTRPFGPTSPYYGFGVTIAVDEGPPFAATITLVRATTTLEDVVVTVGPTPTGGCAGTGTGTAPDGSDAGGDYGGLCDAVLGVGGPLDPGGLDVSYATAALAYGPKFSAGWDAATATQQYDPAAGGGSPLLFAPATPGPANRMVFYARGGVAYLGVWEGRLPPIPFDPTDADYTAAADADPTCGAACFEAVFTDATLLTYAPAVTGGEIVVGTPGGCVPADCDCGTVMEAGTPVTGDDTPGEWLACVTIPADGTYRMCGEILTGSGAYFAYTSGCDGTTTSGRAIESGDGMLGLTLGSRTAGEVVYFRVFDSGGYGAATFTFKVVAGGTC